MSRRRSRELPFGEPRSVAARTETAPGPSALTSSIRLHTSPNFQYDWVFHRTAHYFAPHRLILEAYRELRNEATENHPGSAIETRLIAEFRHRSATDESFHEAMISGLVRTNFPVFERLKLTYFTALDLAIVTGFFDLALSMVDAQLPLVPPPSPDRPPNDQIAHPLYAAMFAALWDEWNHSDEVHEKLNALTVELIHRTSDTELRTMPGFARRAEQDGEVYRLYPTFFASMFEMYLEGKTVSKAVIVEMLQRPVRPTQQHVVLRTNSQGVVYRKYSDETAFVDWIIMVYLDPDIDDAFLRNRDTVDHLVYLYRIQSPPEEGTNRTPIMYTPSDFRATRLLCRRMSHDAVFRRKALTAMSAVYPGIVRSAILCADLTRAEATFIDPPPTIDQPPLAPIDFTSDPINQERETEAREVAVTHAAPVIQTFFPYSDVEERIPSRKNGGSRGRRTGLKSRKSQTRRPRYRTNV